MRTTYKALRLVVLAISCAFPSILDAEERQSPYDVVLGIEAGEWAGDLGIEPTDRIVSINGIKIENEQQANALLRALDREKHFWVSIRRGDVPMTFQYNIR